MPVLSPHRSSSLTTSYRSPLATSSYYSSAGTYSNRNPRYSYSERFTTTSYRDTDGRMQYTRSGSITEDGITTRFREETRENSLRRDSISRDSGISSIRENSILETAKRERDTSLTRADGARPEKYTQRNLNDSLTDLREKYSPANYIPTIHRNKEISRSKSINDIGLPPISRIEQKSATTANANAFKKKVKDGANNCNNSLNEFSNSTNNDNNMYITEDDNGNRQPVSEIRKRFENNSARGSSWKEKAAGKKEENDTITRRPVKLSKLETTEEKANIVVDNDSTPSQNGTLLITDTLTSSKQKQDDFDGEKFDSCNVVTTINSDISNVFEPTSNPTKSTVSERKTKLNNGVQIGRSCEEVVKSNGVAEEETDTVESNCQDKRATNAGSRVNNFSSYIPVKDYEKGDVVNGADNRLDDAGADLLNGEKRNEMNNLNKSRLYQDNKDLSTSPRLNRASLVQNATSSLANNSASSSNNVGGRSSLGRDDEGRNSYERSSRIGTSPVRHQGLNGLKNIGNTCFMNSVIQCLSNTKPLLEYLRRDAYISDINTSISSMKGALIKAFSQVIKELWSEDSSDRVVNTVSLKSQIQRFAPRFMGYAQQDAQEFLRYLLEGLHEDVNRVTTKPAPILTEIDEKLSDADKSAESWQRYLRMDNSKIVDIFVGQLKSTLRCTYCGHCSVTFDPFWDLSLPIPQKVGAIRLQQCLESFTREETLDGDEKPTCSKCKERRKCTKSFSIQKFPKILVIHLKRFSPMERFRGKLSVTVDFPLEGLDMSNYSADNHTQCRYNLYAISNHSGTTYSGHYTAYCRHPYSLSWHEYNDSRVSTISPKSIVSGEAYVLFYELDGQKAHL